MSKFTSEPGVRNHIIYGPCPDFDPDLDSEPVPLNDELAAALREGQGYAFLTGLDNGLEWTTCCQCCNKQFKRSNDLAGHLLSCHADLWHKAQPTVALLMETWAQKQGCMRSPPTQVRNASHVCTPVLHRLPCIMYDPKLIC